MIGSIGQAAGLFAVTNVDDIVLLAVFSAQGARLRTLAAGQYLGFTGILVVAVAAAFGATFLPANLLPWLGLVPLALGVKAGVQAWRERGEDDEDREARAGGPGVLGLAAVTFANGGDNIGVYVPVFATAGTGATAVHVAVFLVLVAVWVVAGRFLATRPVVARALSRWGHVVLPVVLIGIGLLILAEGLR